MQNLFPCAKTKNHLEDYCFLSHVKTCIINYSRTSLTRARLTRITLLLEVISKSHTLYITFLKTRLTRIHGWLEVKLKSRGPRVNEVLLYIKKTTCERSMIYILELISLNMIFSLLCSILFSKSYLYYKSSLSILFDR